MIIAKSKSFSWLILAQYVLLFHSSSRFIELFGWGLSLYSSLISALSATPHSFFRFSLLVSPSFRYQSSYFFLLVLLALPIKFFQALLLVVLALLISSSRLRYQSSQFFLFVFLALLIQQTITKNGRPYIKSSVFKGGGWDSNPRHSEPQAEIF